MGSSSHGSTTSTLQESVVNDDDSGATISYLDLETLLLNHMQEKKMIPALSKWWVLLMIQYLQSNVVIVTGAIVTR
jgi:hypothetical protein